MEVKQEESVLVRGDLSKKETWSKVSVKKEEPMGAIIPGGLESRRS